MIELIDLPALDEDDQIQVIDAGTQLKTGTSIITVVTQKGRLIAYTLTSEGICAKHLDEQLVRGRVTGSCSTRDSLCLSIEPSDTSVTENLAFLKLRQEYL